MYCSIKRLEKKYEDLWTSPLSSEAHNKFVSMMPFVSQHFEKYNSNLALYLLPLINVSSYNIQEPFWGHEGKGGVGCNG